MIRFLHTADWHMDAPMRGFTTDQRGFLRKKMLDMPGQIADLCIREKCDLVLLAGDVFDSATYTEEGLEAVRDALRRMAVPVFVAPGNHDYYGEKSPWFREKWPDNVYIFNRQEISSYRLRTLDCRVYGGAFTGMDCPGLLEGFASDAGERYALMVLHGDPSGADTPYCPVTPGQVRESGLDYLALGHIHAPGRFGAGAGMCAWPGCPMGHGYDETGEKGVLIGELDSGLVLRFVPLEVPGFHDVTISVDDNPENALAKALGEGKPDDFFRVRLTGTSRRISPDQLRRRFLAYPNLKLLDETTERTEVWENSGEDSFEGLFFGLLQEAMNGADDRTREDLELAAKLSRQILLGREVELP